VVEACEHGDIGNGARLTVAGVRANKGEWMSAGEQTAVSWRSCCSSRPDMWGPHRLTAATWPLWPDTVGQLACLNRPSELHHTNWITIFSAPKLSNQPNPVKGVVTKVVELQVKNKFVYMTLGWFGLVWKLQTSKLGTWKLKLHFRLRIFPSAKTTLKTALEASFGHVLLISSSRS
jgi:hypothetical protein